MNIVIIIFIVLLVLVVYLFWSPATESVSKTVQVTIPTRQFAFVPADLTINRGDSVQWTNKSNTWHTVTSGEPEEPNGIFDSGRLNPGDTYRRTFVTQGVYPYYCQPHPWMVGKITIE